MPDDTPDPRNTEIAVGNKGGQVVLMLNPARTVVHIKPDVAVHLAKSMIDEAQRCGVNVTLSLPPRKISEEKRMALYQRAALILRSQMDSGKTPAQAATHVVDRVLQEVL